VRRLFFDFWWFAIGQTPPHGVPNELWWKLIKMDANLAMGSLVGPIIERPKCYFEPHETFRSARA
jgi:hypothetical protein